MRVGGQVGALEKVGDHLLDVHPLFFFFPCSGCVGVRLNSDPYLANSSEASFFCSLCLTSDDMGARPSLRGGRGR